MSPGQEEQITPTSPYETLKAKEKTAVDHSEWIDIHNAGLLELYETNLITREEYLERRREERLDLEEKAYKDKLTGLLNRRGLDEAIIRQLNGAKRLALEGEETLGSAIFLDVDKFKLINDNFKHLVGDEVLKVYARVIERNTRAVDTVGRFGGDEFMVIVAKTTAEQAKKITDRIREQIIEEVRLKFEELGLTLDWEQTVSAGISEIRPNDTPESLIARADTALYYAKDQGRNQALIHEDDKNGAQN